MAPGTSLTQSVSRALSLLNLFSDEEPEWSGLDLSRAMGLNQSTVHRLLTTMEALGYLERNPKTGKYRLGMRLVALGHVALNQNDLRRQSLPVLQRLLQATGLTATLVVPYQHRALYLSRIDPPESTAVTTQAGRHVPIHCMASGKVLLAALPADEVRAILAAEQQRRFTPYTITDPDVLLEELAGTRERGWNFTRNEWIIGNAGVAAPVRDHTGQIVAALVASGPEERFGGDRLGEVARITADLAAQLSYILGFSRAFA